MHSSILKKVRYFKTYGQDVEPHRYHACAFKIVRYFKTYGQETNHTDTMPAHLKW